MQCIRCGKQFFGKLSKHSEICRKCLAIFPKSMRRSLSFCDRQDIYSLFEKYDTAKAVPFVLSLTLGNIALDEMHGILAISDHPIKEPLQPFTLVLCVSDLCEFGLYPIEPHSYRNAYAVNAEAYIGIADTDIVIRQTVQKHIRCSYKCVGAEQVECIEPSALSLFRSCVFQSAAVQAENRFGSISAVRKVHLERKREQARTLYMLEDGYTADELTAQRNRLVKAFHPDTSGADDKYVKKILDAYDILKKEAKP